MRLIRPFRGLRARPEDASRVAAPPYDVMNREEAAAMAAGNPASFLHVSRPEIDLPPETDPYDPAVYAKAAETFARFRETGLLVRDEAPCYYLYRLTFQGRRQLGLAAEISADAYREGRVKKHEFTRPAKEDDRTRHIEALNANTGPVFLVHRTDPGLSDRLADWADRHAPAVDFTADDGVRHEFWVVEDRDTVAGITAAVDAMDALYIADGHHRSAAGARVAEDRGLAAFYGVIFPQEQVRVYDYNRVVKDLGGLTKEDFLQRVGQAFTVAPAAEAVRPAAPREFGMYLDGQWYELAIAPDRVPADDPVRRLDVALLSDHLLEPILGIVDPRRDDRIDFVGGIRGLGELERRVDGGEAVAFSLYPTSLDDLMAVADAGEVMPPKSTWFEPKLRDGLLSQLLD